jgi:type IV pilus assembly protein PilA
LGPSTAPTSTAADLIDSVLASSSKSGYTFSYSATTPYLTYKLNAGPSNPGVTGQRYFYTDSSGVIRADTSTAATSASTPIS